MKLTNNRFFKFGFWPSKPIKRYKIIIFFLYMFIVVSIILTGCNNDSQGQIKGISLFPVQKQAFKAYPLGLLRGRLVLEDGCLRVQHTTEGATDLIVWPYGYSLDIKGSKIQVLNDKGQAIAMVGDEVFVGGGLEPEDYLTNLINQPLPEGTKGPYWLASPSFQNIPYELAPNFPIQRHVQIDYLLSNVEGTLILDKGYLSLDIGNGQRVSPIWPPGSSCRIINYVLNVVDKTGQTVAAVGDKITVKGAELSPEMLGKYVEVYGPPEDFKKPYWLVSDVIVNP